MRVGLRVFVCTTVSTAILVHPIACSKEKSSGIPALDTTPWTVPYRGTLYIKNGGDLAGDLLLMNVGTKASFALDDNPSIPAWQLADGRPIYRYIAADHELKEVAPEEWDTSKGKLLMCGRQLPLLETGTFTHDLITKLLQFKGKLVPTAGPTVLAALPDPSRTYVAVLSAEGKLHKSFMPFADPTVRGDRYHQLFRMSDASEIGEALRLDVETDTDDIRPCWSPDGRYVIYRDVSAHLWIIDMAIYRTAGETK